MPHPFFLNPSVLSTLLHLDTLLLASPFTGSHLCTTDTLISPGFVLLQKGVGCPSGFTLIAVWEHRTGLLSTSPLLYFSLVILCSAPIQWPSITWFPPCLNASYILQIFTLFSPTTFFSGYSFSLFLPVPRFVLHTYFILMQTIHSGPNVNIIC